MNQPKVLRVKLLEYYERHATVVPASDLFVRGMELKRVEKDQASEVVGSMMEVTLATEFAGNPPCRACSRIISSLGAL